VPTSGMQGSEGAEAHTLLMADPTAHVPYARSHENRAPTHDADRKTIAHLSPSPRSSSCCRHHSSLRGTGDTASAKLSRLAIPSARRHHPQQQRWVSPDLAGGGLSTATRWRILFKHEGPPFPTLNFNVDLLMFTMFTVHIVISTIYV
jgi:hypothetical protein